MNEGRQKPSLVVAQSRDLARRSLGEGGSFGPGFFTLALCGTIV